jgi:LexA-binding, inner membrane-associated putative hydrolase
MASFRVHAVAALVGSVGAAAYVGALKGYPFHWVGLLSLLGFLGGLAPDVDSGETRMARYSGLFAGALLTLLAYLLSGSYTIALLSFVPVVKLSQFGIYKWTTHRGVFHSIPMALLLSLTVFYLFDFLGFAQPYAIFCGAFFGGGYLTHLALDELWSLRKGVSKRSSFGTALQIYRPIFWKSFLATYVLLGFALYKLPFLH